jgi:hypothetical protein
MKTSDTEKLQLIKEAFQDPSLKRQIVELLLKEIQAQEPPVKQRVGCGYSGCGSYGGGCGARGC